MRSKLTLNVIVGSLWILLLVTYNAEAEIKHYEINYGDNLGDAEVDLDEANHTAIIRPPTEDTPTTVINFRKGMVIYVYRNECLAARFMDGENKYKTFLSRGANPIKKHSTLYVAGPVPAYKLKRYLGKELYSWCEQKPTSRLSRRKPNFISLVAEESELQILEDTEPYTAEGGEHRRTKRRTKKEKKSKRSKEGKGKSKGNRGKGKKKKNKESKTPETKALRGHAQQLNVIAPRFEFPMANIPQLLTDDQTVPQSSPDHVILQEEPYLSPSFVRTDDDGQRFRHYRDFYNESNSRDNGHHATSHTNRIISLDTSTSSDSQSKISIPETIVKDGQIFYRYDADESNHPSDKGQSKRSHTRDPNFMDDTAHQDEDFVDYDYTGSPPNEYNSNNNVGNVIQSAKHGNHAGDSHSTDDGLNLQHISSIQAEGQMGDGKRSASAIALSGKGPGTHVQGSTDADGYFIAQAHSLGHNGDTSLTHVFGNQHGILGTAVTRGHGRQSHVQVEMGPHSSSTANVASDGGTTLLTSSVHATQLGGNARSQAYGNGASASHAQMEFNPYYHHDGANSGLRGHGMATATLTNTGSTALTSLSGKMAGGSYLGTAHSSVGNGPGPLPIDDGISSRGHEDFSYSQEQTGETRGNRENLSGFQQNGQHQEDIITGDGLIEQDLSHTDQSVNPSHMIGDIMETVHQPDMQHEIFAYPVSKTTLIDKGGLTGGAGDPPRESDIERVSGIDYDNIQEGAGIHTGGSKAGIVGLATYSHGRLGAPPGPGELLDTPQHPSQDYRYYDGEYGSEYYDEDYRDVGFLDTTNTPFFDLGPEIDFEPLESNFENLQPMLVPTRYPDEQKKPDIGNNYTPSPSLYEHEEPDFRGAIPDPPIVVHQVQGLPLLPDDATDVPDEIPISHLQSQYPSSSYTTESYDSFYYTTPQSEGGLDYSEYVTTAEPNTRLLPSHHQTWTHGQTSETRVNLGQDPYDPSHIPKRTQAPATFENSYPLAVDEESYSSTGHELPPETQLTEQSRTHTFQHTYHSGSDRFHSEPTEHMETVPLYPKVPATFEDSYPLAVDEVSYPSAGHEVPPESQLTEHSRTHTFQHTYQSGSDQFHSEPTEHMETVPLYPGVPGSVHSVPGSQGGPDVKVMTLSSQRNNIDRSVLYQRPGTPIQPGEKIPGAPGYRVPPGFRGHVILGRDHPVNINSRKVVEGFNTQVKLSPQNPISNEPLYASVSGPAASHHLPMHSGNPAVHVTLTGGGTQSQPLHSSGSADHSVGIHSSSMKMEGGIITMSRQAQTHASMQAQPQHGFSQPHAIAQTQPQPVYSSQGGSWGSEDAPLPTKSWDSKQYGRVPAQQSQPGRSCCSSSRTSGQSSQQGRSCCSSSKSSNQPSHQSRSSSKQCCTNGQSCCLNSSKLVNCQQTSMQCQDVYGPYEGSRICKPVTIALLCCC